MLNNNSCVVWVPLFLANRVFERQSAAATELRRSRCCDGVAAATESLLRRICADQLRRAHSARRVDELNEEPASFPPGDSI